MQPPLSWCIILHGHSSSFILFSCLPISFAHSSFYAGNVSHRGALTQSPGFYPQKVYTPKPLHTEALTQRSFYTQPHFHAEAFTYGCLYREVCLQRTFSILYTEELLHTHTTFTHRSFSKEKHVHQTEVSRQRTFYTEKSVRRRPFTRGDHYRKTYLHSGTFKQRRVYTETSLHRGAFCTHKLHTERF